jgi:CRP-like cAMP-binding protein
MKKRPLNTADMALLAAYGLDGAQMKNAQHFSFAQGEYLSREGEALEFLYFVVSGKAKVLLSLSDGKQLLLAYFISAGIIGDIELMTNVQTHHATLQAVTDLDCIALPLGEYKAVLKGNNAFINHVGKELAEKLMQRALNGAINTLQPLEMRLSAYALQTATGGHIIEQLTDVAVMLGASYRHLLRCMEKLSQKRILSKEAKGYRILNKQALQALAGDLYVLGEQ